MGLLSSTPRSMVPLRNWLWSTSPLAMLIVETSESPGLRAAGSF